LNAIVLRRKIPGGGAPDVGELLKSIADASTDDHAAHETPSHLVLHNDDYNSFAFVANVLGAVLGYSFMKCLYLAIRVHIDGRKPIWTGRRRQAEEHARRIRETGPDPQGSPRLAPRPLTVTVEAC
jgi:ATP-dependent Clp protease adaptor protein ClpS